MSIQTSPLLSAPKTILKTFYFTYNCNKLRLVIQIELIMNRILIIYIKKLK